MSTQIWVYRTPETNTEKIAHIHKSFIPLRQQSVTSDRSDNHTHFNHEWVTRILITETDAYLLVVYFTKKVNPSLVKMPLDFNGCLDKPWLTPYV